MLIITKKGKLNEKSVSLAVLKINFIIPKQAFNDQLILLWNPKKCKIPIISSFFF